MHRRQSLATASTTKFRMMRRAASIDSDHIQRKNLVAGEAPAVQIAKEPKSAYKSGFSKARKQLKALLGRRQDSLDEGPSIPSGARPSMVEGVKVHNFKTIRFHKVDTCGLCAKSLSGLLVQGYKCLNCKLCFHKECVNFAANIPCTTPVTSPVRKESTGSRKPTFGSPGQSSSPFMSALPFPGSFNLTKTKQQTDPTALLIESTEDLRSFSVFIFKKQSQLAQEKSKRETIVDAVFKRSLREFHMELIGMEAVLTEGNVLKYRDLIATFESLLVKMCNQEKVVFPTTLGVNAFRGFLNEFMQQRGKRKSSRRKSNLIKNVRKKRRRSDVTLHNNHRFKVDFVHVPTYCEICNQFMWHAEKIFICMNCRLSCHKKCHAKVTHDCPKASKGDIPAKSKFFGADLTYLVDDEQNLPVLLNKLLIAIEVRALFVEGIYRKSGALAVARAVRKLIETADDQDTISFEDVPIHVLTTLVKSFFRELAEPLITQELYENFVNVSEIKEQNERIRCLRVMVELLPKSNRCVLDRLMYHLARVAHQEAVNRMNPANLSVIFAPCILRRSQPVHAQEQLMDVQKQAICVQALIEEKLRQYTDALSQIVELEQASEKVSENLRRIDEHRKSSGSSTSDDLKPKGTSALIPISDSMDEATTSVVINPNIESARQLFEEQLEFLDKEKAKLIQDMPPLSSCPVASSEDLSSSELENSDEDNKVKAKEGGASKIDAEYEYAIDMRAPPILCRLPNIQFHRSRRRIRHRIPSKQFLLQWKERFAKALMDYFQPETAQLMPSSS
ncbi:rhoGAP domain-containing protein [Ditylenchus destructor]|uniref:RhoGAP domain-containing protein n=1 Tax=Ditylenchus destructor TaxID=166010 RepID=A0AAD4R8K5_9BILA|nr:rhoGAP domain-containing protein [Ditylenchus destructor]